MKQLFTVLAVCGIFSFSYGQIDYNTQIQPIFDAHCTNCHNTGFATHNVDLSSYLTVKNSSGDIAGQSVVANDTANSPLYQLLKGEYMGLIQMPAGGPYLSAEEIGTIAQWIMLGIPLPVSLSKFSASSNNGNVSLFWETATENNNLAFDIYQKTKGSEWKKVDFVKGNGTSTVKHSYSYTISHNTYGEYFYKLRQIDNDGKFSESKTISAKVVPTQYGLYKNYPNPFNPTTTVNFVVPSTKAVKLRVFNINGEEIQTLFSGIAEGDKLYTVQFNGGNLSSGIYFTKLEYDGKSEIQKMVLTK